MAISKKEALATITAHDEELLKKLEAFIDEKILKEYTHGKEIIISHSDLKDAAGTYLTDRILNMLLKRYCESDKGWEITPEQDQLEGLFYRFR